MCHVYKIYNITSELIKPKGQFLNEQNLRQGLFFRTLLIFFRLVEGKHQKYTLVFILLHFTYLSLKISITTRLLRPFFLQYLHRTFQLYLGFFIII